LFYTHSNLISSLEYSYKVEVLNFNGPSLQSNSNERSACEPPQNFRSVFLRSTSQSDIVVGWRQPLDDGGCTINNYQIDIDDGANGAFTTASTTIGASTFRYTFNSGLTIGLRYRIKVTAENDVGSVVGNVITAVVADVPDTPTVAPDFDRTETN